MADHLLLPAPIVRDTRRRRKATGPPLPPPPERNRPEHGEKLCAQLEAIREQPTHELTEGVDPARVLKIRAASALLEADLIRRELAPLGEAPGWRYFVLPTDDGEEFSRALDAYVAVATSTASASDDAVGSHLPDSAETQRAATSPSQAPVPLSGLIDRIEDIEPYGREDRIADELTELLESGDVPTAVDVLIWPSQNVAEARSRLETVQAVVQQYGGRFLGHDSAPTTTTARITCGMTTLNALLELSPVARVRLPFAPMIEPSTWLSAQLNDFYRPAPLDAVVGVIDDGVAASHPLLSDLVIDQRDFPGLHNWTDAGPHGTLVAGLAAYGGFESALLKGQFVDGTTLPPPVRLVVARVLEPDPSSGPLTTRFATDESEHSTISQAVNWMHSEYGVRVFNLSITDSKAYSGPHASLLTVTLDSLARELDIVIIVAAGNSPIGRSGEATDGSHLAHGYPRYLRSEINRLAEPATGANVLTVGSLAFSEAPSTPSGTSHVDERAIAGPGRPSPFTRLGPGIVGKIKPELVDHGGDVAFSNALGARPADLGLSVVSLSSDLGAHMFRAASGTSFAAARVSNLAARTVARYPDASANLIRCLVGLSSAHPQEAESLMPSEEERYTAIGYGRPDLERATESGSQRVVMTYEGELASDSALVHEFPVPREFAIGAGQRFISVALAYDPPARWQRRDYIAGLMDIALYRNVDPEQLADRLASRDAGDLPENRSLIRDGLRPTQTLTAGSTLIVRRWVVESARALNPDDGEMYCVSVTHRARSWASGLLDAPTTQRYALAVELWDRERLTNLYQVVQRQLQVRIRQQARDIVR